MYASIYLSGIISNERRRINDVVLQIELFPVTLLLGSCNVDERR